MLNATEKELSSLRVEMRKLLEPVMKDVAVIQESVGSLSQTVAASSHVNYSDINNILDNGLPEWSVAAYAAPGVDPGDPGDGNLECHNFYRQLAADVALLKTPAEALKAIGHSIVEAADVPIWDKVNGTMMLGGTGQLWDIYAPIPNDIIFPGQTFLFQLEARLATDDPTPEDRPQMYVGFYDNTPSPPPEPSINAALASNGAVATATSTYTGYSPSGVINGVRHTQGDWSAAGSGWSGGAGSVFPQTVEIDLGQSRLIGELDLITLADALNYSTEPTLTDTFTLYGLSDYDLDYWNGSAWINLAHVTGNNLVWRKFTFPPVTATKVRCVCLGSPSGSSTMVEFEAWTASVAPAAQQKYIEGGEFTITGEIFGPLGTPGRSVDYQILAKTDSGEEALSNVLNFPHAPDVFTGANHPRIHFAGVAGFIQFLIYRRIGAEFVHQYTVQNSIEGSYFDMGNPPIAVVTGFPPTSTERRPRAYAITTNFAPFSVAWTRYVWVIFVPTTYDRSVTQSGMQYLRFGLTETVDVSRQILIRRIGLSQGDGAWARSPNDVRAGSHSSPSTTAAGSAGGSGPGIEPPPPPGTGGGGGGCVLVESMIDLADGKKTELRRLDRDYLDGGGAVHGRVRKIKTGHVSRIYRIKTDDGQKLGCSYDHPLITEAKDHYGTRAKKLKKRLDRGDEVWVLTRLGKNVISSRIVEMKEDFGDFLVGEPHMDGSHIYIANGFLSHNKISIEEI
jgi:hypothetical protein